MLSRARQSRAFSPADLSPALWLEADARHTLFTEVAGSTTPNDTETVGRWADKSMNSFDLAAIADDTTRPTWVANSGVPYVNVDGSNDLLTRAAGLGLLGNFSVFLAMRGNPATNRVLFGEADSAGGATRFDVIKSNNTTATTGDMLARNAASTIWFAAGSVSAPLAFDNTDKVYGVVGDASQFMPYINKVAQTPAAYTASGTNTTSRTNLGLVYTNAVVGAQFAARVYAIVAVKKVLMSSDINALVTYLGTKMGLSL